ncbi:Sal-like protein 3 [Armadillidium vulgare]|nr:Sal-like protein 3 [Armadillidium vulgare]
MKDSLPDEDLVEDLRRHQDEANNNNQVNIRKSPLHSVDHNSRESSPERSIGYDSDNVAQEENDSLAQMRHFLQQSNSQLPIDQQLAQSNIALEAIQNTRTALVQLATKAFGNGQPASPQAMQEMAVLQSTLYTLQHQQMMQIKLIQQLHAQLSLKNTKDNENHINENHDEENIKVDQEQKHPSTSVSLPNENEKISSSTATSSFISSLMERFRPDRNESRNDSTMPTLTPNAPTSNENRDRPISPPMTASNIASSVIQHTDPPPPEEPNTLEMLQRTANEVLNNASQGLLTNRLIDDYSKPPDGKDAYYKHRCRYCGKVFGSDSALQIHVRSHTGERPFKCNICGNRFTTKGNLKVHFSRHSARFPHVKMNPHPVPEHLDKLHPPLLAQLGELKDYPSPPTGPPNPFGSSPLGPSLPPFRLPGPLHPNIDLNKPFTPNDLLRKEIPSLDMEEPENLSGTRNSFESDDDQRTESERIDHRKSNSIENDKKDKEDMDTDSNDSRSAASEQPTDLRIRPDFRHLPFPGPQISGPRLPFPFLPGMSPPFLPSSAPPTPGAMLPNIDPSKDPNIYANLLPRPGSTDNSWEALIEVEKASETMKLESLVNNIEHKLSDPNQCVICHRVLSCKSALQMHYRTHTGERPFKCKICGRAFTTKGNLKTHMGVHRAKPPMRMLHQCPVCHKKFTNALVLQQHIKLHTGEPTDLTPEQIAAAEVRDFPHSLPIPGGLPPILQGGFPLPSQPFHGFPPIHLPVRYQLSPDMIRRLELDAEERRDEEERYLRLFNTSPRSSSTSSAEQRIAEDLSVRMRNEELNGTTSPHHSVSPTPSDYSDIEDKLNEGGQQNSNISLVDRLMNPAISHSLSQECSNSVTNMPIDLASRPPPPLFSHFGLFSPPLTSSFVSSGTQSLPSMSPLYMPSIPGRGNTTCQVCFKTFACQSALEIHYRSHTKERPFKCTVCDRGFSTKGNMKQHMLTHKMKEGNVEENTNHKTKKGSKNHQNSNVSSKDEEEKETLPNKKDDSGVKREREGEIFLPVSKRPPTAGQTDENSTELEENGQYNDEPPVLSPEVPVSRSFSPLDVSPTLHQRTFSSTSSQFSSYSSIAHPSFSSLISYFYAFANIALIFHGLSSVPRHAEFMISVPRRRVYDITLEVLVVVVLQKFLMSYFQRLNKHTCYAYEESYGNILTCYSTPIIIL